MSLSIALIQALHILFFGTQALPEIRGHKLPPTMGHWSVKQVGPVEAKDARWTRLDLSQIEE
jgi:hypothetical protein